MQHPRSTSLLQLFLASLLFLSLGALTTVRAQDIDEDAPSDEPVAMEQGTGFFAVGAQFTDLAPLNDRLGARGGPPGSACGPDASMQGPFLRLTIGEISGPDDDE